MRRSLLKLNLGCGLNRLDGWRNCDSEIDIAKPLPFNDGAVDFILCEHCVEHVEYFEAINFLIECRRVLSPKGVARIIVPSLEQIWKCGDRDYYEFTKKWQKLGATPTPRGAMDAILYSHGHLSAWTADLLRATIYFSGFDAIEICQPHQSRHHALCEVDGHHKIIGEKFNGIESLIMEGSA